MKAIFSILLAACFAIPAHAGGYTFSNGFYWSGGVPFSRYTYANPASCTGYSYGYKRVYYPAATTSNVTTTNYSYTINNSQAAAAQGNTVYGVPATQLAFSSYGNLDLGATIDGLLRLSSDMQVGARDVAGDVRSLTGDLANVVASNNQAVAAVAELEAKTRLLQAATPSPQVSLNLRAGTTITGGDTGNTGGNQVFAAQAGNLVTTYCAKCHAAGGANADSFALSELQTLPGLKSALARILTDDPKLAMPKGVKLDDATRGSLIQELSQ